MAMENINLRRLCGHVNDSVLLYSSIGVDANDNSQKNAENRYQDSRQGVNILERIKKEWILESKSVCYHCQGTGHWARHCISLPDSCLSNPPPRCYCCGGKGHYARFCPSITRSMGLTELFSEMQQIQSIESCQECAYLDPESYGLLQNQEQPWAGFTPLYCYTYPQIPAAAWIPMHPELSNPNQYHHYNVITNTDQPLGANPTHEPSA
jgi:hypothetical protein